MAYFEHAHFAQSDLADLRIIFRLEKLFDGDDAAGFLVCRDKECVRERKSVRGKKTERGGEERRGEREERGKMCACEKVKEESVKEGEKRAEREEGLCVRR